MRTLLSITSKKDYSISIIRFIATVFIVTCHFMQYYDYWAAWWFNVGVQIFLCMSGFLYGKKDIFDPLGFIKKQALKILIEYYIVLFIAIGLQLIIVPEAITLKLIIGSLLMGATLKGGGHLWYIPYILLCYILTPLLGLLFKEFYKNEKPFRIVLGTISVLIIFEIVFIVFFNFFNPAWINCYVIGFAMGFLEKKGCKLLFNKLVVLTVIVSVLMNIIQLYLDYFSTYKFEGVLQSVYSIYCNYAHVALGCGLFFGMRVMFTRLLSKGVHSGVIKACNISDKYSYNVYLVHQFLILGPLSLMKVSNFFILNFALIICLIVLFAIFLSIISRMVRKLGKMYKQQPNTDATHL